MGVGVSIVAFVLGAAVSLATSWVLVSRLERLGDRLGSSEAMIGLVAALAADAPEITASVTAVAHHQQAIGAGVVIGSNVFNMAALLGLGAIAAGWIGLPRKVVLLSGTVAMLVALSCLLTVAGVVSPAVALATVIVILGSYFVTIADHRRVLSWLGLPPRWTAWLTTAIVEEQTEIDLSVRHSQGTRNDGLVAAGALVVVVIASIAMEQGASVLGRRYGIADIVVGGLVLAAVTSLPNAVAAIYLARKGRGSAALSTALNSNAINVAVGLLIPATIIGLANPSAPEQLVAGWYLGLTAMTLALAYTRQGLSRTAGWLIIAAYITFVALLLAST